MSQTINIRANNIMIEARIIFYSGTNARYFMDSVRRSLYPSQHSVVSYTLPVLTRTELAKGQPDKTGCKTCPDRTRTP